MTVIPVASRSDRVFPFQVRLGAGKGGLERSGKALCEQIRKVSRQRLKRRLGGLALERMEEIRAALERHLWFEV